MVGFCTGWFTNGLRSFIDAQLSKHKSIVDESD